jgi:hypothetical protein
MQDLTRSQIPPKPSTDATILTVQGISFDKIFASDTGNATPHMAPSSPSEMHSLSQRPTISLLHRCNPKMGFIKGSRILWPHRTLRCVGRACRMVYHTIPTPVTTGSRHTCRSTMCPRHRFLRKRGFIRRRHRALLQDRTCPSIARIALAVTR